MGTAGPLPGVDVADVPLATGVEVDVEAEEAVAAPPSLPPPAALAALADVVAGAAAAPPSLPAAAGAAGFGCCADATPRKPRAVQLIKTRPNA